MVSKKTHILVALSGGVDSSVSALLLKRAGYRVSGAFIRVWQPDFLKCSWQDERLDAMRICATIDIPFHTVDLEAEYKRDVVDYMIYEYRHGRVPNPDVMCNRHIKFGAFWKKSKELGADMIATGHYARIDEEAEKYRLLRGKDVNKDQSYFLWTLGQKDLSHTLFPIGKYTKPKVRAIAKKHNLITASKKDSQGLCFIGKIDMKDFLKRFIDTKQGKVLNIDGKKVGTHEGAILYTLGQRHGFTVSTTSSETQPYYVVDKDIYKNTITVARNSLKTQNKKGLIQIENINWISNTPQEGKYLMQYRYRQKPVIGTLKLNKNKTNIQFDLPITDVASGQSVVLYKDSVCLGGGTIS